MGLDWMESPRAPGFLVDVNRHQQDALSIFKFGNQGIHTMTFVFVTVTGLRGNIQADWICPPFFLTFQPLQKLGWLKQIVLVLLKSQPFVKVTISNGKHQEALEKW